MAETRPDCRTARPRTANTGSSPAATNENAYWRWNEWLFAATIFAAVFFAYRPAWNGQFLWDDDQHVTRPELRSLDGLRKIWLQPGVTEQYYPITHTAFWIQYHLWGDSPLGYHWVNLLLHATSAVLVTILLRRLAIPGAFWAGAIFALHPVQAESVAWITELKNCLSGVFYFGAAIAYLGFDRGRTKRAWLAALGLFVLALLSKTAVITLPPALLVVVWWRRGCLAWRRDVLPLVPLVLVGILAAIPTVWIERDVAGAKGPAFALSLVGHCLVAGRDICFYLGKLVWPAKLLFIYPRWNVDTSAAWQYAYPAAVLFFFGSLWARRRHMRGPVAAMLFFVGTLFPMLGFVHIFAFLFSYVADHWQYLACLGPITLATAGASLLLDRLQPWGRAMGIAILLAIVALLATLTCRQSRTYADLDIFYGTMIERNPDCWLAYCNLANLEVERGQLTEAIQNYERAIAIRPDFAEAHDNLGNVLAGLGRTSDALAHYKRALEINPGHAKSYYDLGTLLLRGGDFDGAATRFRAALGIRPDYVKAHQGLGDALYQSRKLPDALAQWREVLEKQPDNVAVLNLTAWALATSSDPSIRDGAKALRIVQRAIQLSGSRDPSILETVAAAEAEIGRFPEAVKIAQQARSLAGVQGNAALVEVLDKQIQLYSAKTPVREVGPR